MTLYRPAAAAACAFQFLAGCARQAGSSLPPVASAGAVYAGASSATVWWQTDGVKILQHDPAAPPARGVTISGAKGETVSFQIVVTAKSGALSNVVPSVGNLVDSHGHTIAAASAIELFRQVYVDLTHRSDSAGHTGWYPDGLVPIGPDPYYREQRNGAPFTVSASSNQPVWVDVTIPSTAVAGTYRGTATIESGKSTLGTLPVTLTVWNFALPATSSMATAFGLDTWGTYQGHYGSVWNTKKITTLTNLYQAEALKHRISLYDNDVAGPYYKYDNKTGKLAFINYATFDSTMEPDMAGTLLRSGAQGTVAEIPNGNPNPPGPSAGPNDAEYVAYWKAVSQHFKQLGWYGRNFYYDLDEPHTDRDYAIVRHRADVLHQADPGLLAMDTTKLDSRLIGHIDIWTVIVNELDSPGDPPPSAYTARQKLGEKVWMYHSDSSVSHGQWPDFFVDHTVANTRIFSWIVRRYGLNGFLYYATTVTYTQYPNPWTNVYSFGDNGDGVLFYPGRASLIGGTHDIPCDSIRLKEIRAAMQDYEYMKILDGRGQSAFVDSVVRGIVLKTDHWNHSTDAMEKARATLAARITGQ